jgi:hypothetical protein
MEIRKHGEKKRDEEGKFLSGGSLPAAFASKTDLANSRTSIMVI